MPDLEAGQIIRATFAPLHKQGMRIELFPFIGFECSWQVWGLVTDAHGFTDVDVVGQYVLVPLNPIIPLQWTLEQNLCFTSDELQKRGWKVK